MCGTHTCQSRACACFILQGNRDVIDGMAPGSSRVMNEVLKLIDAYDLYGSVAYPKKHSQVGAWRCACRGHSCLQMTRSSAACGSAPQAPEVCLGAQPLHKGLAPQLRSTGLPTRISHNTCSYKAAPVLAQMAAPACRGSLHKDPLQIRHLLASLLARLSPCRVTSLTSTCWRPPRMAYLSTLHCRCVRKLSSL